MFVPANPKIAAPDPPEAHALATSVLSPIISTVQSASTVVEPVVYCAFVTLTLNDPVAPSHKVTPVVEKVTTGSGLTVNVNVSATFTGQEAAVGEVILAVTVDVMNW